MMMNNQTRSGAFVRLTTSVAVYLCNNEANRGTNLNVPYLNLLISLYLDG